MLPDDTPAVRLDDPLSQRRPLAGLDLPFVRFLTPRLTQSLLIGFVMAGLTLLYQRTRVLPSDFAQLWVAARAWLAFGDPYAVIGPGKAFEWQFPLLYPMPAVLVAVPFAQFPLWIADPLFVGLGAAAFAYAVTKERWNDPRLLMFLTAGAVAMQSSQWSSLLSAAAVLPWLGFLLVCKPTLGLALLAAFPKLSTVTGMVAFAWWSLIAWPNWPWSWWDALPTATHVVAPITRPGGFLILAALYRWRLPEARFLVAWACLPHSPILYEAVPLFLFPTSWREAWGLTGLIVVAGLGHRLGAPYADYLAFMQARGIWMLWAIYLPCVVWILLRDQPIWTRAKVDRRRAVRT